MCAQKVNTRGAVCFIVLGSNSEHTCQLILTLNAILLSNVNCMFSIFHGNEAFFGNIKTHLFVRRLSRGIDSPVANLLLMSRTHSERRRHLVGGNINDDK